MIVLYCFLLLLLLLSLFLFTLLPLRLEIRDIWRPGAGLAGTWDSMAQIRDNPGNPGRVATLLLPGGTTVALHVISTALPLFYSVDMMFMACTFILLTL